MSTSIPEISSCMKDRNCEAIRRRSEDQFFVTDPVNNDCTGDDFDSDNSKIDSLDTHILKLPSLAPSEDPLIILGFNISLLSSNTQYYICATGFFGFTIVYGYVQELISVHIGGRKYALFLATCQFAGYSFWSFVLLKLRTWRINRMRTLIDSVDVCEKGLMPLIDIVKRSPDQIINPKHLRSSLIVPGEGKRSNKDGEISSKHASLILLACLALVRAIDLGMTNSAMKFINYPAKTLIKSSRAAFTIIVGLIMGKRGYLRSDYLMVVMLCIGLIIFLRADKKSDALFHPYGVIMLTISLFCDGVVANSSELVMRQYRMSQDQFQLSIYSISFLAMLVATILKGEFYSGIQNFFILPGTITEITASHHHQEEITWTASRKLIVMLLFTFTGLLGSSFAGALTKHFGALSMSVVSTNRKATTLLLSFMTPGFHNRCTWQHVIGMIVFLIGVSVRQFPKKNLFHSKRNTVTPVNDSMTVASDHNSIRII